MPVASAHELLAFLSTSDQRVQLMRLLAQHPATPAALEERSSASRATVHRVLAALTERDWVAITHDADSANIDNGQSQYKLAAAGELVLQEYTADSRPIDYETIAFIATSEHRIRLLRALNEQLRTVEELLEQVAVAQTTVYRALTAFKDRNWVHADGQASQQYGLTAAGQAVLQHYTTIATTVSWIAEHAVIINDLGELGATLPAQALTHEPASIITNERADPDRAFNYYADQLQVCSPDRLRAISPAASMIRNKIHDPLLNKEVKIGVVIDTAVLEVIHNSYAERLNDARNINTVSIAAYPGELGFGLSILEKRDSQDYQPVHAFVFVYRGIHVHTCIHSTTDALAAWAIDIYQDYQQAASLINSGTNENEKSQ